MTIQQIKFQARTARVKNISFHPSKPWVIVAMRSGLIQLWDYNLKISIAKFDQHDGGVRGVDFHPQLPLFVSGGDDSLVKVWDYKQKRCLFTLIGHIDYIRTTTFHHQLPWILSASDDQTMRIWNYQSRACVNIITGHSHYVMAAQFHPQKNLIVSGSLDGTVRLWDFTILKKKLTQSKNLSSFVGIQIECIKVLQGHQRGVDWVCFHPSQNLIASGADDKKIKLWKYTNEVAWQHSTITGHRHFISCLHFDKKTGNLISCSEDKTTRVWDIQTKSLIKAFVRESDRYWVVNQSKNGNLIGLGHDNGFQIVELNKQIVPHGMIDDNLIIFAQGMKTFMYDTVKKNQKQQLYQYKPMNPNTKNYYINQIIINPFQPTLFIVQINQNSQFVYTVKKKQSYLNYPYVYRTYTGKDSCFISKTKYAVLVTEKQIHIYEGQSKEKRILKLDVEIKKIFSTNQQETLACVLDKVMIFYSTLEKKIPVKIQIGDNQQVRQLSYNKNHVAIVCKSQIIITDLDLNQVVRIKEKFEIKSAFWQSDDLLFYTTQNHWKYTLLNGQNGLLKTLAKPIHLLKRISKNSFLAFNQEEKVFETSFPPCAQIQFKLAVDRKDWNLTKKLIQQSITQKKKFFVSYLVEKGLSSLALDMVENPQEKFSLAIQATNFQLAFEICSQINTQQYWKLLGQEALKQGIYEAYQLANQKLKNFDKLNFLYSLQGNTQKMQKILKLSTKMQNPMLSFNVSLMLNKHQQTQRILRECGLDQLAALNAESRQDASQHSDLLRRLGSKPLQICQPQGQTDFSNWPHNVVDQDQEDQNLV